SVIQATTGVAVVVGITFTCNYLIPITTPSRLQPASNFIYMTLWTRQMLRFGLEMAGIRGNSGKVKTVQVLQIRQTLMYLNRQMITNLGLGLITINCLKILMIN